MFSARTTTLITRILCSRLHQISRTEKTFNIFEDKYRQREVVAEYDFSRTFNQLRKSEDDPANLSLYSSILLKTCGKLMADTPPKERELLAHNLWKFMKAKEVPLRIVHYNSLIESFNDNGTDYNPQLILDEMASVNLEPNTETYKRLIHGLCVRGDIQGATNLLEKMKDSGLQLNESIFASLILGYGKQESPPSIAEIFDLMRSNAIQPSSISYTAALASFGDRLEKNPQTADELNQVYEMMENDDIDFSLDQIIELITHLGRYKQSNATVTKLLCHLSPYMRGSIGSRYRLLGALVKANLIEDAANLYWASYLGSGGDKYYWIRLLIVDKVSSEYIVEQCQKLFDLGQRDIFRKLFYEATERHNFDLIKMALDNILKHEPMKAIYSWPLLVHSKNEDDLISVLKNYLDPTTMSRDDLSETFTRWVWSKFIDKPDRFFELNKELHYPNSIMIESLIGYIVNVEPDRTGEIVKFIIDQANISGDEEEPDSTNEGNFSDIRESRSEGAIAKLLQNIAETTKDPKLVRKVFNICRKPRSGVASLIRVHLYNGNLSAAVDEYISILDEYNASVCGNELICELLEKKDPENLKRVIRKKSSVYGPDNALFDLAVSCLRVGKLEQAQKIFASPGFRVNPQRIYVFCKRLVNIPKQVEVLENLISLTRDIYDINQDYLYELLLSAYESSRHEERALELWKKTKKEGFNMSENNLIKIAKLLEKKGIEVPFEVPTFSRVAEQSVPVNN